MTSPEGLSCQLVDDLANFNSDGFLATIDRAVTAGMSVPEVLDLLIAPAQQWVGARWESGAWNVAQEHLATAIATRGVNRLAGGGNRDRGGPVLVTCAEGEWHTLGLSMVSVGLQSFGYETITLGGPLPSGQLIPFLHESAPLCITVSCQMLGNLPGARRMIATAREAGTPAIVGGSGVNEVRARVIGANGYAKDVRELDQVVGSVHSQVTPVEPLTHGRAAGFEWVDMHLHSLAAELAKTTQGPTSDSALEAVWILRALNAALLCDDPAILQEQTMWQNRRTALGDGPPIRDLIGALKSVVGSGPEIVTTTIDEAVAGLLD